MLFSKVALVATAAFLELSVAAPASTPGAVTGQSFSVTQKATGRRHQRSGHRAIGHAYKKFGKTIPATMLVGMAYTNVSANPEDYDVEYLTPVAFGTPAKELNLVFDTGSSDLWVYADGTTHGGYSPAGSSSASQLEGQTWSIHYGDGSSAGGNVYADKVVIGSVTLTSQAVEAATSVSSGFGSDKSLDGILGLGGDLNNQVRPTQQPTMFQNMQSTLASPVFGVLLKHNAPGAFDFGYLDPTHYSSEILYAPADLSQGYWQVTSDAYYIGYTQYSASLSSIVDTGTSLIFMTEQVVTNYWGQVPGAVNNAAAGGWIFPCSAALPTFGINLGSGLRTIPGSAFNYAPATVSGMCYGGLQSSAGFGFNILGDVFLKSCYAVFDVGNSQVGFANQGSL